MTGFDKRMAFTLQSEKIQEVVQLIDRTAILKRYWRLTGGVSAQMIAVEFNDKTSNSQIVVLRWHGDVNQNEYGYIVEREYHLLTQLVLARIPVPDPLFLDKSATILATTFLVLRYVPGATSFSVPYHYDNLRQAAETLAHVHQLQLPTSIKALLPSQLDTCSNKLAQRPNQIDTSLGEERIRQVLETAWPWDMQNNSALLHGDYWPGNWLWNNHELSAVIDWEDAKMGDPLADLAISRLDILWAFGETAMITFTNIYQKIMPAIDLTALPYWDLYSALRPMSQLAQWAPAWADYGRDDVTADTMREAHIGFVSQALDKLDSRD